MSSLNCVVLIYNSIYIYTLFTIIFSGDEADINTPKEKIMKSTTAAYIAGILDGEGTITLVKRNSHRYPIVSVSSTSKELLDFLRHEVGGTICNHKTYKDHHKQSWSWRLTSNNALNLLNDVIPFMLEKKKLYRANILLNEYKSVTPRNGKYTEELLNKKKDFEFKVLDFNGDAES